MIYRFNTSERRSKLSMILDYNKYMGSVDVSGLQWISLGPTMV